MTFKGNEYFDTVSVTGNSSIEFVDKSLHRVVKTYADNQYHQRGWLPETTFNAAIDAIEEYPNKRLVVHFMQPHTPYLGKHASKLRQSVTNKYDVGFSTMEAVEGESKDHDEYIQDLVEAYERGYLQRDDLNKAYAENLEIVFEYVEKLLADVDGKTIITSDHSESLGYIRGVSTHKDYALSSELREVPWLVIDQERRKTFAEPPSEPISVDEETVRENLRDLGYM